MALYYQRRSSQRRRLALLSAMELSTATDGSLLSATELSTETVGSIIGDGALNSDGWLSIIGDGALISTATELSTDR